MRQITREIYTNRQIGDLVDFMLNAMSDRVVVGIEPDTDGKFKVSTHPLANTHPLIELSRSELSNPDLRPKLVDYVKEYMRLSVPELEAAIQIVSKDEAGLRSAPNTPDHGRKLESCQKFLTALNAKLPMLKEAQANPEAFLEQALSKTADRTVSAIFPSGSRRVMIQEFSKFPHWVQIFSMEWINGLASQSTSRTAFLNEFRQGYSPDKTPIIDVAVKAVCEKLEAQADKWSATEKALGDAHLDKLLHAYLESQLAGGGSSRFIACARRIPGINTENLPQQCKQFENVVIPLLQDAAKAILKSSATAAEVVN